MRVFSKATRAEAHAYARIDTWVQAHTRIHARTRAGAGGTHVLANFETPLIKKKSWL